MMCIDAWLNSIMKFICRETGLLSQKPGARDVKILPMLYREAQRLKGALYGDDQVLGLVLIYQG